MLDLTYCNVYPQKACNKKFLIVHKSHKTDEKRRLYLFKIHNYFFPDTVLQYFNPLRQA